ncbi:MAG TPA: MFS transporter, partial [Pyrinomonadaceae bacterium]|nr:MFS transporter [Pyrinomonadaceae bacterium]
SIVSLLNDVSSEIIYPLLPVFLSLTLGASPFAIGAIEGAAESAASLLKLAAGYLSDKFGKRKWAVFAGYGLSTITRPLLGLATGWTGVLFIRLADRVGKGIRTAPRDALVADSVSPEKRGMAFGFHRAMDSVGAVIGPLIGFFLIRSFANDPQHPTADEFAYVFLAASIPAVLTLVVISFFVKESQARKPQDKSREAISHGELNDKRQDTKEKFNPNFKRFLFILALFTLSNSSDAFLLLRAEQAGVAPVLIPLLWMALNLVKVLSSLVGGDLSDRIGRKSLIVAGWILYAAVYCGFAFVTTASGAWSLFLIYGIYFGLTEGVEKALVADLVPAERRGTAFGWYHLAYGIAVFPASLMLGAIWNYYGFQAAFLLSAAISLAAALLLLTVRTKQAPQPI